MLIYGDVAHQVCGWNAVDVLVDGLLQHGRAINTVESGLIVDFECTTQCAQHVEFGNIFHTEHFYNNAYNPGDAVQVLLRPHPTAPWTWYPGKAVALGEYDPQGRGRDAQYVEVQLPYGAVMQLVPRFQVRRPPSEDDCEGARVEGWAFVTRCCQLPADWDKVLPAVRERFQFSLNQHRLLCTVVHGQTLLYLQREAGTPITAQKVEEAFELAKNPKPDSGTSVSPRTKRKFWRTSAPRLKRRISCLYNDEAETEPSLSLPPEILLEIFQTLDSIERIRCQRVHPLWNLLLTTDAHFPVVRVSGMGNDYGDVLYPQQHIYWVLAGLLTCLNSRTTMLVLTDVEETHASDDLVKLIPYIRGNQRVPVLVLFKCKFDHGLHMSRLVAACFALGERLIWKNCTLEDGKLKAVVTQYTFRQLSSEQMERQLWDLFESNLVLTKPLNRPAISQWFVDCVAQRRQDRLYEIERVLDSYHSRDPRSPANSRPQKWTRSALRAVDISQLTVLTVAALDKVMNPPAAK
ncbi:uncharacterized protein LOC129596597 [Paramacrobiotus metropolitanus]|uniref:uncharacterized protein LOC129596597 n=1 Tax=Paramacrobiotus metropolitanus TaxID=2943436 RepID=UPI002445F5F9|nr:uncharacterized protein LOC129596597 [Paramacrobiotus metropolitanus]